MEKIKRLILYILNIPLYWIAKFVPKDNRVWIFGAWFGDKYADNSRCLFEYINKNHPEIQTIWITSNKNLLDEIKNSGYKVYLKYSIPSIFYGLKAKYSIFVHSNNSDCMLFLNNGNTKLIQLWHGAPIKKIGNDDKKVKDKSIYKSILSSLFFPFLKKEIYDIFTAIGNEDSKTYKSAFNQHNVNISGLCRNDNLFDKNMTDEFIIMYLPTFRDNIGDKVDLFSNYNFESLKWNEFLSRSKIKLYIKMHPVNKPKKELLDKFSNNTDICFLEEIDVAEILPKTDILITDYSSVFLDFVLTDRPIIFAPFDYDTYINKDRELYYDYDEVTPGPKCKDWSEVLIWIEKFKNDPILYLDERKKVKGMFHKYQDGKSCERVYFEILKIKERLL